MSFTNNIVFRQIFSTTLLCVGVALLSTSFVWQNIPVYTEGEIVTQDIEASIDFDYLDQEEMQRQQDSIRENMYAIYQLDTLKSTNIQYRISDAFSKARKQVHQVDSLFPQDSTKEKNLNNQEYTKHLQGIQAEFEQLLGVQFSPTETKTLLDTRWGIAMEQVVLRLVDETMQNSIIDNSSVLPKEGAIFDVFQLFSDSQSQITLYDTRSIQTLAEAKRLLLSSSSNVVGLSEDSLQIATHIAKDSIQSNFTYDYVRSKARMDQQIADIQPTIRHVTRGLSIVRKGDKVSPTQAEMLRVMYSLKDAGFSAVWVEFVVKAMLTAFVAISLFIFGSTYVRKFAKRTQDIEAMVALSLLMMVCAKLLVNASVPISVAVGFGMNSKALWYFTPMAGGAMLIRILTNSETTIFWIVATSLFLTFSMEQNVFFAIFFLVSGAVASASLGYTKDRMNMLRAGLQTGLLNAAMALLIESYHLQTYMDQVIQSQPLWDVGAGLLGGVVSAFLVLGLLPVFESMGFVTDYQMLELSNLNHPLLRQLFLRAPGTYHHSMTMAQLSEAAAEAIGANALQAKVACYYHDIGKSLQPQFFIENQRGSNPHDGLQPHQSARVIMTHVVDGLAMAKQQNLPQPIVDAIEMHHGTGLIKYFYVKALEQAVDGELVDEKDFRYVGRRPNTKEAGIIFLADRVEAGCRSLKDPTQDDFNLMIKNLVNSAITEGQLEECPLTLRDLYIIMDVFAKTMASIYHHRIEYPKMPEMPGTSIITLEVPNPLMHHAKDVTFPSDDAVDS